MVEEAKTELAEGAGVGKARSSLFRSCGQLSPARTERAGRGQGEALRVQGGRLRWERPQQEGRG